MKLFLSVMAVLLLAACDEVETVASSVSEQYGLIDEYPAIKNGIRAVQGVLITEIYLPDNDPAPIMIALDGGARLLAEAQAYGNHSLEITPQEIACKEIVTSIDGEISPAFVDLRGHQKTLVFQVYKNNFYGCEPK